MKRNDAVSARPVAGTLRRMAALTALTLTLSASSCGFIVWSDPDADAPGTTSRDSTEPVSENGTSESSSAPRETTAKIDYREEADKRLDSLPDRDLSASSVIIATSDAETICPDEAVDAVSTARVLSKRAVEEKYNTHIIADAVDASEMLRNAKEAYAADMYYADLLAIPQNMLGAFYSSGILANMNSLPYADYTQDYYDDRLISEAILGNELRAVSGAANFNPEYLSCIYFNRDIIEELALEDPYELVYTGKWTWDKFGELAKAAAGINGVSGHGSELGNADYIDAAATAMKIDYVNNPEGKLPTVVTLADDSHAARAKGIVDRLYKLFYSDGSLAPSKSSARELFLNDSLLFYTDWLYITTWIPDIDIRWGLLPLPKYDESQNGYQSLLSADAPIFCALSNTTNYETSGLILEALNASCHEYVQDAYMNERINYYLRDNDSINMLEIIVNSATTDFAHMFASGFPSLANATYSAVYNAVTTRSTLEALVRSYQSAANNELSGIKMYG